MVGRAFGGRLEFESGGMITLSSNGLVAANSSLRTNAFTSPVWQVGSPSLLGEPGRSYWIEVRDSNLPGEDWTLFRRVALTGAVRPLGIVPELNLSFRVREFVADPPLLEMRRLFGGPWLQVVLFGARTSSYAIESASNVEAPTGGWSTDSTVTLTNSFHFFPPVWADEPARFFRVRMD
jgi:hypothetical protein